MLSDTPSPVATGTYIFLLSESRIKVPTDRKQKEMINTMFANVRVRVSGLWVELQVYLQ